MKSIVKRFIIVLLLIVCAFIFVILFSFGTIIQYILTGKADISEKFHQYISKVIDKYNL